MKRFAPTQRDQALAYQQVAERVVKLMLEHGTPRGIDDNDQFVRHYWEALKSELMLAAGSVRGQPNITFFDDK